MNRTLPFLKPHPASLSRLSKELAAIEASGIFSNYGPVNTLLEKEFVGRLFGGTGACLTVCNATIGLLLAAKQAARAGDRSPRYAIMPSFTFAATAQAALWAGLVPVFCDIDGRTWLPCGKSEENILRRLGREVALLLPCATFGNALNTAHYQRLTERYGVPVVIDAAASLGTSNDDGNNFGTQSAHAVVYSMHVTKTFATSEGGLIYSSNEELIRTLRIMGNFGFGEPRTATMPGLNAKLSEVGALLALHKLEDFDEIVTHRAMLANTYRSELPGWEFQEMHGRRHAYQFMPALLPRGVERADIISYLAANGIGSCHYFSPHVAEQAYFCQYGIASSLEVTNRISSRIISLPMSDEMTSEDVSVVCALLRNSVRLAA